MRQEIQNKVNRLRKDKFLVVVDFAGTLFALGPDKNHVKDPFIPEKMAPLGAIELDPSGCQNKKLKPFQKGIEYGWTVIPSVARLLHDLHGVNVVASSVADDPEQVSLQKMAYRDNHIRINHIMTKDADGIIDMNYKPRTIVVLGDTSSDVALAEKIAELSPQTKVICGFTPSGMEQQKTVQETLDKKHPNIEFISGKNWSIVIRQLRKRLPIKSQHLHQLKKLRKKNGERKKHRYYPLTQSQR
ncbi:MAG: hypothetical protein IJ545_00740 [Alphaproteobacteria bacterium]|nr:hypothetical protein [Alphaproteobacteria bacterium]